MRLLALSAVAAAALGLAAPAHAECDRSGRAGVCLTVVECARICDVHLVVDPYCNPVQPIAGACTTVDNLYVEPAPR